MAVIETDARKYALVKLRRVLRRADLPPYNDEVLSQLQRSLTPQQELILLWSLYAQLIDPHPGIEIGTAIEKFMRAGLLEVLISILTHFSALSCDYDPREAVCSAVSIRCIH